MILVLFFHQRLYIFLPKKGNYNKTTKLKTKYILVVIKIIQKLNLFISMCSQNFVGLDCSLSSTTIVF